MVHFIQLIFKVCSMTTAIVIFDGTYSFITDMRSQNGKKSEGTCNMIFF